MLLSDILTVQRIKAPLAAETKTAAIEELVDVLSAAAVVDNRDAALAAVLDRERTRTTGIGNGLAIPHGKCSAVKQLVMALGKPKQPIDFQSIDGKPVTLVVLLLSPPDMTGPHIQALAHLSRLMSLDSVRKRLDEADTPEKILTILTDAEKEVV